MRSTIFSTTVSPLFHRVLAVSALGLCLVGVTACGSTVDPSETAAAPAAAAQAVPSVRAAGPGGALLTAVDAVSVRADQKVVVDNLRATLTVQPAPVRAARAALGAEIAQQVRSGVIDHTRTQSLVDQLTAAIAANGPAVQQAVQQLHDTLDASQRQALVAALPARGDHAAHGARRAEMKGHMDKIAAELNLTDEQRTAIHDQMRAAFAAHKDSMRGDHGQMKGRMEAIATAFTSDTFDAKALGVGEHAAAMMSHFGGMHGAFLDVAVPLLTPAQRAVLATKIQSRMAAAEPAEASEAVEAVEE